jgi:DNA-binding NarL/FixJ family response regulator
LRTTDERQVGSLRRKPVGVLTVDDQPIFLGVAREVIEETPGFRSLGEASSGEAALAAVEDLHPGLVLMDVRMPGMDGVETTRCITRLHPDIVVVLISIEDTTGVPSAAASSGAVALVRKQDFGPALLRGLWAAHGRPSS